MIEIPNGCSERRTQSGIPVLRIHYSADPERDQSWKQRERNKYSSQAAWDREQEIIHEAGGGELIFREILNHWKHRIIISEGFTVSPFWTAIGAFDHGKTNPTAALLAAIDGDGTIYVLGEYYQPQLGAHDHILNLRSLRWRNPPSELDLMTSREFPGYTEAREILTDPSIFARTQQQANGTFKSIADLYYDAGLHNLAPAPNNAEIAGMERILEHWRDLEHREPTLKIVCPEHYNTERKQYGLFRDGCPNLIWELNRARREQLSAQQLLTRNISERVVDKDNHLRDCLKYLVLSLPSPADTPLEVRLAELAKRHPESLTNVMIQRRRLGAELVHESEPIFIGSRAKTRQLRWRHAVRRRRRF